MHCRQKANTHRVSSALPAKSRAIHVELYNRTWCNQQAGPGGAPAARINQRLQLYILYRKNSQMNGCLHTRFLPSCTTPSPPSTAVPATACALICSWTSKSTKNTMMMMGDGAG
jgi:hypothetical protein